MRWSILIFLMGCHPFGEFIPPPPEPSSEGEGGPGSETTPPTTDGGGETICVKQKATLVCFISPASLSYFCDTPGSVAEQTFRDACSVSQGTVTPTASTDGGDWNAAGR